MSKEKNYEINILDVLVTLARHKFFIIKLVFSITIIALVISLLWPKTYKSSATFIPVSQQRSLPGGMAGLLGGTLQLPMDFPRVNPEVMINILRSRELRKSVIHEFNLQELYGSDLMEDLLIKLDNNMGIGENREGGFGFNPIFSTTLSFISDDPQLSHDITLFILEQLNQKILEINLENATEQLLILEERFQQNLEDLEKAEIALLAFQEEHGVMEIRQMASEIIGVLGELKASSIETEMAIAILSQSVGPDNVDLVNLRRMKEEYDRQFELLMQQSELQTRPSTGFHPLMDIPEISINYFRLYRNVQIQARIMESIYPQYESQRMVVNANTRGLQVIDPPFVPTYKDGPKRAFIVLGGMFFSIFLSLLIVFLRDMYDRGKKDNSENYRKMQELARQFQIRKRDGYDTQSS